MGIIVEIDEKQAERLRALTHRDDLAQAVGQAIQQLAAYVREDEREARLAAMTPDERQATTQRAWEALLDMSGAFDLGGNAADRHDEILYGPSAP